MSMAISILHSSHRYAFVLIGKQLGGPDSVLAESAEQTVEVLNVATGADAVIGTQISVITEFHAISVRKEIFIEFEPRLLLFPTYAERGRETACLVALKIRRGIYFAGFSVRPDRRFSDLALRMLGKAKGVAGTERKSPYGQR